MPSSPTGPFSRNEWTEKAAAGHDSIAAEPGHWDAPAFAKELAERTATWGKVAANTSFERQ